MLAGMVFRKEPFFYGHDNYDQLVKIAKVLRLGGEGYCGSGGCVCVPLLGTRCLCVVGHPQPLTRTNPSS